jgi:hypothetical protein
MVTVECSETVRALLSISPPRLQFLLYRSTSNIQLIFTASIRAHSTKVRWLLDLLFTSTGARAGSNLLSVRSSYLLSEIANSTFLCLDSPFDDQGNNEGHLE